MQQVVFGTVTYPRVTPHLSSNNTCFDSAAASSESVADFAIFMIIATFRNLNWCTTASLNPTTFKDCHTNSAAISHNPRGHTLGIIGLGNIGFTIALKAYHAFHMEIIYYDVIRKSPTQEQEIDARFVGTMDELLGQSDCIVLATPASPDGKKIITQERVEKMKMGSRYVETFSYQIPITTPCFEVRTGILVELFRISIPNFCQPLNLNTLPAIVRHHPLSNPQTPVLLSTSHLFLSSPFTSLQKIPHPPLLSHLFPKNKKLTPPKRFINIARGSLVDTSSLAFALSTGRLIGLGLDVHEDEPNIDPRLKNQNNVTLTAHNAGGTLETYAYPSFLLHISSF